MIDPKQFFRFGSNNFNLLQDLHGRSTISDSDLRNLVKRHRHPSDPSASYTIDQLSALGFVETAPHATASKELTGPVVKILDYLLRSQRLTPFKVLEGYINALEQIATDLDTAIAQKDGNNALRIINECNEVIEQMRQHSSDNRECIIRETIFIKSNVHKKNVTERYEIVNRIREKYLVPLRDIVDIHRPIQGDFEHLGLLFEEGIRTFKIHGPIPLSEEFVKTKARLLRLRKSIRNDFEESRKEIDPLYTTLKKENQIIQGASRALEIIDRKGLKVLGLEDSFHITGINIEGIFSDSRLEGFFYELTDYDPVAPEIMAESFDETIEVNFIDPDMLSQKIKAGLPIKDSFKWLIENYPDENLNAILQAYVFILKNKLGKSYFENFDQQARFHGFIIKYFPLNLAGLKDGK